MVQLGKAGGLQCLIWQATLSLSDADDQENERAEVKKLMSLTTNVALGKIGLSSTYE
jgi:hypothetical protein